MCHGGGGRGGGGQPEEMEINDKGQGVSMSGVT